MALVRNIVRVPPAVLVLLLWSCLAGAQEPGTGQVTRQGMLEMLNEMEQLQREMQQLRGELEVQSHIIEQMRRQQRQQYVDVDQRINRLQSGRSFSGVAESIEPTSRQPSLTESNLPTPVVSRPEPDATAIGGVADEVAYNNARGLLADGQYIPAVGAFRKFILTYPVSTLVPNAQYWLAETYYKTRQFKAALDEFLVVVEKYPGSPKALDAKLKIGFIHYELQDWQLARQVLTEITEQPPSSTAVQLTQRLAQQRLERMGREGH